MGLHDASLVKNVLLSVVKQVLIIEDDPGISDLLEIHLKDISCHVVKAFDGQAGVNMALESPPDLVILDISLPKLDGLEVCKRIRAQQNTPIIMLTARTEDIDKILGLELGADDYITKPFNIREFIARVKAVFRRTNNFDDSFNPNKSILSFSNLEIDIEKRKVTVEDQRVDLSPKEFDLLVLMASNPGRSYTRSNLLQLIWGYSFDGYEHTVNSHINRLRAKIEPDMSDPTYILTVWGVGYCFNEDLGK